MSFDRWIRTGSIISTNLPQQSSIGYDNPRISLNLEKDIPELTNKIFDKLLNYHVCAENQVNELLQQFEYSKVLEKSEKSVLELEKSIEQSTQKILQTISTFDETNPELQKSISISLAYAQDWVNKRVKPQQQQQQQSNSTTTPSSTNTTPQTPLPTSDDINQTVSNINQPPTTVSPPPLDENTLSNQE